MTWHLLFGLVLFSAHVYGRSQLAATTSYVILAKEQCHNSYTFWAMPILIFSPVYFFMRHPLESSSLTSIMALDITKILIDILRLI